MKRSQYICQLCRTARKPIHPIQPPRVLLPHTPRRPFSQSAYTQFQAVTGPRRSKKVGESTQFWGNDVTIFNADNAELVHKAQTLGNAILNSHEVSQEEEVQKTLEFIRFAALQLNTKKSSSGPTKGRTPTEDDEGASKDSPSFMTDVLKDVSSDSKKSGSVSLAIATKLLSTLAYKIVKHEPVFLSASILETYVGIQLSLNQPESLPEIFDLYAYKPFPEPNTSPIKYTEPNPSKPSQAIPEGIAKQALDVAIKEKNLPLALDLISSTYGMPAFRRSKFVRKALPGITGLTLTPLVAVPLAQQWASQSLVADSTELTIYATMGILTYVGTITGLGYISATTYNDQMERVTWMPGTALRDRWLREEERAVADKVALAWGFKDMDRRGEEEGDDWEMLKDWCGQRGMLVDASELMDGME